MDGIDGKRKTDNGMMHWVLAMRLAGLGKYNSMRYPALVTVSTFAVKCDTFPLTFIAVSQAVAYTSDYGSSTFVVV